MLSLYDAMLGCLETDPQKGLTLLGEARGLAVRSVSGGGPSDGPLAPATPPALPRRHSPRARPGGTGDAEGARAGVEAVSPARLSARGPDLRLPLHRSRGLQRPDRAGDRIHAHAGGGGPGLPSLSSGLRHGMASVLQSARRGGAVGPPRPGDGGQGADGASRGRRPGEALHHRLPAGRMGRAAGPRRGRRGGGTNAKLAGTIAEFLLWHRSRPSRAATRSVDSGCCARPCRVRPVCNRFGPIRFTTRFVRFIAAAAT